MADKKFSPMRYTASTEAAATAGALQIVGVSREEVEVEIIEQSAKGVTVRIRPRAENAPEMTAPPEAAPDASPLALSRDSDAAPIAEDVPELLAESDETEAESDETDTGEAETMMQDASDEARAEMESEIDALDGGDEELDALAADFAEETPDFEAETGQSSEVSEADTMGAVTDVEADNNAASLTNEAPEVAPLDAEIVADVQQKAQQMLDKMGLDAQAQIEVAKVAGTAALVIEGDDVGILIGKHGATLQAFQYLLNLTLNAHLEGEEARQSGIRVAVDAGNYRARRQSSLEQIARSAASKVRRDGRVVRLEPMPAHERRLVHMFLQTESDVVTQSEGREPMRRIVVAPVPTQAQVQAAAPEVAAAVRAERAPSSGGSGGGTRSGFGAFRRGDAQSERNRGLQNRR